jgi:hypothetical protein
MNNFVSSAPDFCKPISYATNSAFEACWYFILAINNFIQENQPDDLKNDLLVLIDTLEKTAEALDRYQDRLQNAPNDIEDQMFLIEIVDDCISRADISNFETVNFTEFEEFFTEAYNLQICAENVCKTINHLLQQFQLNSDYLVIVHDEISDFLDFLNQSIPALVL